jgi:hypothetical protein
LTIVTILFFFNGCCFLLGDKFKYYGATERPDYISPSDPGFA